MVSPSVLRQRARLLRLHREQKTRARLELPPGSFREYVGARNPGLLAYEHVPRLVDVAERVVSGEILRLLVLLPPRYFKSEIFSRLLPGYFLRQRPGDQVGLASYGASLAWDLSEEARDYYRESGGQLSISTSAKKQWKTDKGGEMWAAGVGGPMLGFGYHLGIVDDPTDPEKAESLAGQQRFEKWWPGKFLSRQEPGAAIVFVMQRLGTSDPVDFLFRREVGEECDEDPQNWHVVVCEEIKDDAELGRWDGPRGLPPTVTIEPDPRKKGEVLAPSRFSPAQVEKLQRAGAYVVAAQRQQRPARPDGDFWRERWFTIIDEVPDNAYDLGKDWDTAYTKDDHNAASAYVESARGPGRKDEFPIYITNVNWEWLEYPELVEWMQDETGPHYIEAKATGKSAAQSLRREGVRVDEVTVEGDKLARSSSVQPVVSRGRVFVLRSAARRLLHGDRQGLLRVRGEVLADPKQHKDLDLNDAFVQAITRHVGRGKRRPGVWYPGMDDDEGDDDAA